MTEQKDQALALTIKKLAYKPKQIEVTLQLLADGNTVPFIARYRKEMTGALDEVQIREISETYTYLQQLTKRKEEVIRLIAEQDQLTPDLQLAIEQAEKMQQVEDLYRPYKQKRRTKATIAKEKGLDPLASWLLQTPKQADVMAEATRYVNQELEVLTPEEALAGAHEIMAEMIGDQAQFREYIRSYTYHNAQVVSEVKKEAEDEKGIYANYYAYTEAVKTIKPHRILAINRGEKENVLKVSLSIDTDKVFAYLQHQLIHHLQSPTAPYIISAYEDSYKRFIAPSIEREIRQELTQKADEQAIQVFGDNLKQLLLQPPMKERVILGLDPAYRTGCKLAIIDHTGKVLDKGVIYPHKPASQDKREQAGRVFVDLLTRYQVDMVAIGNGTASRESEQFVAEHIKKVKHTVYYVIVNEAGASVYSASEIARQEFPDYQVEERSAVSIARRLQDPLAELVKIDPKSVGVGQYQYDVSQKRLEDQLDFVVETVVNQVGVNVNTASAALLARVAGMNKTTAQNVVAFRDEFGAFHNRLALKKVPRLGPKAFEQAVGFLRIPNGESVLDNTPIHPESYDMTLKLLKKSGLTLQQVGTKEGLEQLKQLDVFQLATELQVGKETLQDIIEALEKPGRDVRDTVAAPLLRSDVLSMEDLKVGMSLQGTVRNVVDFGAFVDIGVKQDGLVHLSKMSDKFVKHASDVVSVGDIVTVWIDSIDMTKQRISLTMIAAGEHDK